MKVAGCPAVTTGIPVDGADDAGAGALDWAASALDWAVGAGLELPPQAASARASAPAPALAHRTEILRFISSPLLRRDTGV